MDPIDESQQSIYDLLEAYFKQYPAEWSEARQKKLKYAFCKYYPYPTNKYKFVLHEQTLVDGRSEHARRRNRYTAARLLVLLGVPAPVFGIRDLFPEDEDKSEYKYRSRLEFLVIPSGMDCTKEYAETNLKYINQTTNSLRLHDYLGKGSVDEPEKALGKYQYLQAHNTHIFPAIIQRLKEHPDMIYTRVLGLPSKIEKRPSEHIAKRHWQMKLQAIKHCSCELFQHICECLDTFEDTTSSAQRVTFAVARASRTHQFGLFDNRFVYNEYYRINKEGTVKPSFLTINDVEKDADIKKLLAIYNTEVDYLCDTTNLHLRLNDLERLLKMYKSEWSEEEYSNIGEQNLINRKIEIYNKYRGNNQPVLPIN